MLKLKEQKHTLYYFLSIAEQAPRPTLLSRMECIQNYFRPEIMIFILLYSSLLDSRMIRRFLLSNKR